jgi:ABC-2 type transport system ATP-binding protein
VVTAWEEISGIEKVTPEDGRIFLLVKDSNDALPSIFDAAAQSNVRITSVDIQEPNLETVFLHLTGRALRD